MFVRSITKERAEHLTVPASLSGELLVRFQCLRGRSIPIDISPVRFKEFVRHNLKRIHPELRKK